jgi:uncharacterized protein with PIN domain
MQRCSNQELTSKNHSEDFLCPHCGATGFEVIGIERHIGELEEIRSALVLRCLKCHGQYWHLADIESSSLQAPHPPRPMAVAHS